jgi:hypothetical protein
LKSVVDRIVKVKAAAHHVNVIAAVEAQTSAIATNADHAVTATIALHEIVMIAAHANSTTEDHADHAQNAATALSVIVMIATHANSTTEDHADHAVTATIAHLVTGMLVLHADHLVAKVPTLAGLDLAAAAHVNAAQSAPLEAHRPSVHLCRQLSARMRECLVLIRHRPMTSSSLRDLFARPTPHAQSHRQSLFVKEKCWRWAL